MAKFATIDPNGAPTGFYDDAVHASIPKGAVPIPDAEWRLHIDGKPRVYDTAAGSWAAWKPTAAEKLASAQSVKLAQLAADYQAALESGVSYQGAMFESDDHSQLELAKVLTAIANGWALPTGFAWIDASNTPHPVPDVAWLQGLAKAQADHKAALFARLQAAKAAVRAATTVTAVNKVAL